MTFSLDYDNYLAHYGVKGMKWGVRKNKKRGFKDRYKKLRNSYESELTVVSKNGIPLTIKETKNPKLVDAIGALRGKESWGSKGFSLRVDGEEVGGASFRHKENGELNLVWLGIEKSKRGQGYGQAAFDAAVEYGRQSGSKFLTLEVPGNAPDARHIYERRGFKVVKEPTQKEIKEDFIWGGLTHMRLDISKDPLKHSEVDYEIEKALLQTFSWFDPYEEVSHIEVTYENYLAHYGVKGMKIGVQKDNNRPSSKVTYKENKRGGGNGK